ncbi:MAG: hypothetical protein ACTHWZ_05835 [Peptoniphilaceae bacterium]
MIKLINKSILKTLFILIIAIVLMKYFDLSQFIYTEKIDGIEKVEEIKRDNNKLIDKLKNSNLNK